MEKIGTAEQEFNEQIEKEMEQETITISESNVLTHIKSKQIKSKLKAVEFVLENFESLPDESKETISEIIADFLKEANPTLVENSLKVIQKLFQIGKAQFIKPIKTFKAILEKTMTQAKKNIVDESEALLPLLADRIQRDDLVDIFKTMLANKNPKVLTSSFTAIKYIVAEYGVKHLNNLKELFPLLEKAISAGNNAVKKEGTTLYIELWKYMGELMKDEKEKLSKFMQKDIEDGLTDWNGELLRGKREEPPKGGKAKVDLYEMADEVDIWAKYKEKWAAAVLKKSKWKEKFDDLEALNKDMDVMKIANGPYKPVLEMLKRLTEDSNANVQVAAVRGMGLMCKGLRHHFKGVINLTKSLVSKLKNKKSTMSEEVAKTILNFLLIAKLADFSDIFNENFKDKNPVLKINLLDLAKEAIEFKLKENEPRDCETFLFKIKVNFESLGKDASKEVRDKLAEFMKFAADQGLSYDHMPEQPSTSNLLLESTSIKDKTFNSEAFEKLNTTDKHSNSFHSIHDNTESTRNIPRLTKQRGSVKPEVPAKKVTHNTAPPVSQPKPAETPQKTDPTPTAKSFLKDPSKVVSKPNVGLSDYGLYHNTSSMANLTRPSLKHIGNIEPKPSTKQLEIPKFPVSTKNIMMGKSLLPNTQSKAFLDVNMVQSQAMIKTMADPYASSIHKEPSYPMMGLKQSQNFGYFGHADNLHSLRVPMPNANHLLYSTHQVEESVLLEDIDEEMEDESFWANKKKDEILRRLTIKLNSIDGVEDTNDLLIKLQRHTNDFKEVENLKHFSTFLERLADLPNVELNATSFVILKNVLVKELSKPKATGQLFYHVCEKLLLSMGPFRFYAMIFNYIYDKQYVNNLFVSILVELLSRTPSQLLTDQQVVLFYRAVEFFYSNLPSLSALTSVVKYIVSERLFELKDEYPELLYVDMTNIVKPQVDYLDFPNELYEEFSILKSRGQEEFSKYSRPVLIDEEVQEILKFHQNNKKKINTLEKLYFLMLKYSKFYFSRKDLDDKFQTLLADCLNGNEANKQALKYLSVIWFLYSHANGFEIFLISKKFITMFSIIMLREKNEQIRTYFARTIQRHLSFDSVKNITLFFKMLEEKSPELKLSVLLILSEKLDQMKESEIVSLDKTKIFVPLFALLKEKKKEVKEKAEELLEFLLTFFQENEIGKLTAKQPKDVKDFVDKFYSSHNNSQMKLRSFQNSHSPAHDSTINFLQLDNQDYNIYDNKKPISHMTSNVNSRVASREHQKRKTINLTIDDDLDGSEFRISHSGIQKPELLSKSIESTKQLISRLDPQGPSSIFISGYEEPPVKPQEKKQDLQRKPTGASIKTVSNLVTNRKPSKDYIVDDFIRFEILERLVPFELTNNLLNLIDDIFSFAIAELLRNCLTDTKSPVAPNFFVICDKMYQPKFINKRNIKLLFLCLVRNVLMIDQSDSTRKEKVLERLGSFMQNLDQEDGTKTKLSNEEYEVFCDLMEHLDFQETHRVLLRDDIVQRVIVENVSTEAKLKVLDQIYDQCAQRPWMITSIKQENELHQHRTKILIEQKEGILFCFAFGPENDILDIFIGNDCFHEMIEKDSSASVKGFLILFERFKKTIVYKHFWNEKFMVFILDNCWEMIKEKVEEIDRDTYVQLIRILIDLLFCGLCYSHPKINKLIRNLIAGASKRKLLGSLLYVEMDHPEENNYLQGLLVSSFENMPYAELSACVSQITMNSNRKLNAFGEYIAKFKEEELAVKNSDSMLDELKGLIEAYRSEIN